MNDSSIYVYNLTKNVSVEHLKEIFMHFGNLKDINFLLNDENVDGKDNADNFICAKIKFENDLYAKIAKEFMNGGQIDGKTVSIKYEHIIDEKEKEKEKEKVKEREREREKEKEKEKYKDRKPNSDKKRSEKRKYIKDDYKSSTSCSRVSKNLSRKSSSSRKKRRKKSIKKR
ncbi:RNA-binding protein s1, putative [Plasmodium malariae]|uniref:RNA-binding protein s1, putative n=1 Tax=Plasmodium malariae TaxID=5858 RepID=A0A1C3KD10_PLAMA|nr:RNA-binding protein s1, putative [Plasmodium malariae]